MTQLTPPPSPEPRAARARVGALWVVALYALFASLWILLSDHLVALWIGDPQTAQVVSILKGWIFVGVTSVLLYFLVWRGMSQGPLAPSAGGIPMASWPAPHRRRRWLLYLLAIATTLATLFLRTQIAVAFGDRPLLILLMFPILLSATVGGLGPGLTATLLAALGIAYAAIPPVGSLRIAATHDLLQWGFLVLNGVLVSMLSEQMHRARQRVEANLRLQSVTLAGIADGVIAVDPQGRIGFFNAAAARLTGWQDEQALGRPLAEVVRLLDPDRRESLPWPLAPTEDSGPREALLLGREGEVPVRTSSSPIASARDGALGRVLVLHDIREEQAVALLRERERAQLKRLIQTLPDLVWLKDPQGVYLACNRRFERFFGAPESEILGRTDDDFVPRELADFFREKDRAAMAAGRPTVNEEELRFADDGHREWVETIKTPLYDADGGLLGVLGIARDITAARDAALALRESEERLRIFIEHAPAALAMFDREMRYVAVSRRWQDAFLPSDLDVLGRSHYEVIGPIPEHWREAHRRGLAGEVVQVEEDRFQGQDGSVRWLRWEVRPWHATDGSVGGIVIFSEDITERNEREARYRAVVESTPDGFWTVDGEGRIQAVNDAYARLSGYSREELRGMHVGDLEADESPEAVRAHIDEISRQGSAVFESRHRAKDGRLWPVEVTVSYWPEAGGYYFAFLRDIARRKQAETALRDSERRYRELVQSANSAIVRWSRDGTIAFFNEYAERFFGWPAEEVVGKRHIGILVPDRESTGTDLSGLVEDIVAHPERYRNNVNENLCRDGRRVWMSWTNQALRDERGEVTEILTVGSDITDRLRAEEEVRRLNADLERRVDERTAELRQARAEAERLARAKGEFLANMSHEIRTPLNAVLGFARIGLRDNAGRDAAKSFERILASGEHLLGVINDVLDYSKIEAGKLRVESIPFQLESAVANAGGFVSGVAGQKGIGYSAALAPDLPAWVLGDAQRVQQVLANLLSNAVKFTDTGQVRLEVARAGDDIRFQVSDTGIGMSEEQLARLFTPFEQADGSTTRRFGGTGLGLAISHELVQLMGGEIGVESAPGRGSTFRLRLPLPETAPPNAAAAAAAEAPAPGTPRLDRVRVLAAEDLEVNRLILEDLLGQEGAEVRFAENGREALALVERLGAAAFDIALMDIQMPEMDGYAATRELRRLAPGLPVIGLTAHALAEERARCLEAGMVDHVAKPVDPEQLVAAIRRHLQPTAAGARSGPAPAPPVPPLAAPGTLDWTGLLQRFGGRRAFVDKLVAMATASEADTPARLRQAADAGDAAALAFVAHSLKGAAGNLMAHSVYDLALATERAARGQSPEAFALARDLAEATERLLAELTESLPRSEGSERPPG